MKKSIHKHTESSPMIKGVNKSSTSRLISETLSKLKQSSKIATPEVFIKDEENVSDTDHDFNGNKNVKIITLSTFDRRHCSNNGDIKHFTTEMEDTSPMRLVNIVRQSSQDRDLFSSKLDDSSQKTSFTSNSKLPFKSKMSLTKSTNMHRPIYSKFYVKIKDMKDTQSVDDLETTIKSTKFKGKDTISIDLIDTQNTLRDSKWSNGEPGSSTSTHKHTCVLRFSSILLIFDNIGLIRGTQSIRRFILINHRKNQRQRLIIHWIRMGLILWRNLWIQL